MSGPRQEGIGWEDLPRERQRRLAVLIGNLVRQRLSVKPGAAEASDERDPAGSRDTVAHGCSATIWMRCRVASFADVPGRIEFCLNELLPLPHQALPLPHGALPLPHQPASAGRLSRRTPSPGLAPGANP